MRMSFAEFEKALAELPEVSCGRCEAFDPYVFYDGYDNVLKVVCLCRKAGYTPPTSMCVCFRKMDDLERVWDEWKAQAEKVLQEKEKSQAQ